MAAVLHTVCLDEWRVRARKHPAVDWSREPEILWKAFSRPYLRFGVVADSRGDAISAVQELEPAAAIRYVRTEPRRGTDGRWRCRAVAELDRAAFEITQGNPGTGNRERGTGPLASA